MELELTIESKAAGAVAVQRLPLNGRIVLGRGPESPVALDGPQISREHIAFEDHDGELCVTDLSVNGSWVNGEQLVTGRRYLLTEADRVQVPGYELLCALLPGTQAAASAPASANAPSPPGSTEAGVPAKFLSSVSSMEMTVMLVLLAAIGLLVLYLRI